MRKRDRVADANQHVRDLRNKLHEIEQTTILPLRAEVAGLQQDKRLLTKRAENAERMMDLYRKSWEAMLNLQHALVSGKAP